MAVWSHDLSQNDCSSECLMHDPLTGRCKLSKPTRSTAKEPVCGSGWRCLTHSEIGLRALGCLGPGFERAWGCRRTCRGWRIPASRGGDPAGTRQRAASRDSPSPPVLVLLPLRNGGTARVLSIGRSWVERFKSMCQIPNPTGKFPWHGCIGFPSCTVL